MRGPGAARHHQLARLRQGRRGLVRLRLPRRSVRRRAVGGERRRRAGVGRGRARHAVALVGGRPLLPAAGVRPRRADLPRRHALPRRQAGRLELQPAVTVFARGGTGVLPVGPPLTGGTPVPPPGGTPVPPPGGCVSRCWPRALGASPAPGVDTPGY